ncbi:MAG TPA: hypothetical protein VG940_08580 [Gemmatimonadales bacterium]|nr:hypothetical protein [Gemmatimonadales bacterium]
MSLLHLAVAAAAVAAWFVAWALGQRRIAGGTGPLRAGEAVLEAALLTAFAALWFGSLGHGGWWVLFAVLAVLIEGPIRGRHRADLPAGPPPLRPLLLGTVRLLAAGLLLSLLL